MHVFQVPVFRDLLENGVCYCNTALLLEFSLQGYFPLKSIFSGDGRVAGAVGVDRGPGLAAGRSGRGWLRDSTDRPKPGELVHVPCASRDIMNVTSRRSCPSRGEAGHEILGWEVTWVRAVAPQTEMSHATLQLCPQVSGLCPLKDAQRMSESCFP